MKHYCVAIIGGGPGGYEAAIRLNQYGVECVVIEKDKLGGVCLNWGCIPTKALVKSAELWREVKEAEAFGLDVSAKPLDYKKVSDRKNDIVSKLYNGIDYIFTKRKIPVIKSAAIGFNLLEGKCVITLDSQENISSDFLIIATGSAPKELNELMIDEKDILSSNGILTLETLPRSLAVIGGGVIGCEFASLFSSFGVEVHLIEFLPSLVSTEDEEVAKRLQMLLKKRGMKVKTGTGVRGAVKSGNQVVLQLTDGTEITVEKVLVSTGRKPVFDLDASPKPKRTPTGAIDIDKYMLTSLPGVYAIGDVTGKLPLAHTASKQGLIAAAHIYSRINQHDFTSEELVYENIPRCTFTYPEIGSCGLTEVQAMENYGQIKVGKFPFSANGKALAGGDTNGFVKLIARADNLQLIGMHIIGPNATELIAQGSILINLKAQASNVEDIVFAHPTLSEAIMEAAEDLQGQSIHKM